MTAEATPQNRRQGSRRPGFRNRPNRGRPFSRPGFRRGTNPDRTSPHGHWSNSDQDGFSPNGR